MELDTTRPVRGSEAAAAGRTTKGLLRGTARRRVEADTYVGAAVDDTPLLRVRAALVRAGPTAVANGWSACVVHGLDVASRPVPVEIAATDRRLRPGPGLTVRRAHLPEQEVTEVDGTRATTMLRTGLDLACGGGGRRAGAPRRVHGRRPAGRGVAPPRSPRCVTATGSVGSSTSHGRSSGWRSSTTAATTPCPTGAAVTSTGSTPCGARAGW